MNRNKQTINQLSQYLQEKLYVALKKCFNQDMTLEAFQQWGDKASKALDLHFRRFKQDVATEAEKREFKVLLKQYGVFLVEARLLLGIENVFSQSLYLNIVWTPENIKKLLLNRIQAPHLDQVGEVGDDFRQEMVAIDEMLVGNKETSEQLLSEVRQYFVEASKKVNNQKELEFFNIMLVKYTAYIGIEVEKEIAEGFTQRVSLWGRIKQFFIDICIAIKTFLVRKPQVGHEEVKGRNMASAPHIGMMGTNGGAIDQADKPHSAHQPN